MREQRKPFAVPLPLPQRATEEEKSRIVFPGACTRKARFTFRRSAGTFREPLATLWDVPILAFATLFFFLLSMPPAAHAARRFAIYNVPRTDHPPKIDGRLDDACWQNACTIAGFHLLGASGGADAQKIKGLPATEAFLTYDVDHLYVGWRCVEPMMDALVTRTRKHDGPTWKDDAVEMFFDPTGERMRFVQIVVNAAGVIMDGASPGAGGRLDLDYESMARAATHLGKSEWTAEIAIPFAGLPSVRPSATWAFHLARDRRPVSQNITCLRARITGFHEIDKFDCLHGIRLPDRHVSVEDVLLPTFMTGVNICRVTVRNWTARTAEAHATVRVKEGLGSPAGVTIPLNPKEQTTAKIPFELSRRDVGKHVIVDVTSNGRTLRHVERIVRTIPPVFGPLRCPVFYFDSHRFVRVTCPVNLGEGSLRSSPGALPAMRLIWTATDEKNRRVGDGFTMVRGPNAVLRLYWPLWRPGAYRLHVVLNQKKQTLATTNYTIRLVESPWAE